MAFRVTREKYIQTEADRIESIVLQLRYRRKVWTREKLQEALSSIGIDYTKEDIAALNDELHKRGIVEDVPETQDGI